MASWKILVPVLNRSVTTFRGPVWYLGEGVSFGTMHDGDFGALWRYFEDRPDQRGRLLTPNAKCVSVALGDHGPTGPSVDLAELAAKSALLIQSALNLFSAGNAVVLSFAAAIRIARKVKVIKVVDLDPVANMQECARRPYRVKPAATPELVGQLYRLLGNVLSDDPHVGVTLARYNSSMIRATERDRIIDITTSLESLIRETHELRFKFATYLSFVACETAQDRMDAFHLLTSLYDARSGLVHGTPDHSDARRALERVSASWDRIGRVATAALSYYVLYLASVQAGDPPWHEHLKRLVLGVDCRIVR